MSKTFVSESEVREKLSVSNKVIIRVRNDSNIFCPVKQPDGNWTRDGILNPQNEEEVCFQGDDFVTILTAMPLETYDIEFLNTETPYDMWTYMKTENGYSLWTGDEYGQRPDGTLNTPEDNREFASFEEMVKTIKTFKGIHHFSDAEKEFSIIIEEGKVNRTVCGWFSGNAEQTRKTWEKALV